ncbi:hypothetical protein [Bifidobacterium thermacidophilum]|uniref:hypothetical protein n=1 Tax=Bifidobacterium thermacidophilum TaxID=246618 RepID=UPI003F04AD83
MIHAEGNGVAQAMGWAWADENTHKYGGAPRGTVYLGALTGILQALRSHTGSQRLAIKTDCHQAIAAIEAARSGHKPTTPSSRKNFPLIQAVLDEISRHNASVSFHDIDEETPVMALETARLVAQQQLQTFVTNPKHAPTGIPRETMDVMIRRRLISKESIAKAQQNAKALNQQQTGKPAHANKPTTKQNATKQNDKLTKQTEALPNVGKNNASTIRDGKTANDAVASRNNVTPSNVTASVPAPIHAAHAAPSQSSGTPTPVPYQPNPALREPVSKPVPEVPAPPRPRHAAVETEVDEPQESQLLELLHSTVRNLRSSAKALQATAQAYDSALKRAKDATPGLDGNPITPLSEKPLRKARKHTKAAALEYEKAAEELEQFLNSYGDTDSVSAQESLHAARWNQ